MRVGKLPHGAPARHGGTDAQDPLLGPVGIVIVAGIVVTLILRNVHPYLTPFAPVAGLFVITRLLQDRKPSKDLVAQGRGAIGEDRVGRALARLPTGWVD